MLHPVNRRHVIAAVAAASLAPGAVFAQSYPERPIKYLVPYPAGGGADFIARQVAAGLSRHLGQEVIVDNRPGGSAIIATQLAANSPPDGYTILLAGIDALAFNTAMFDKLPYDPVKDFTYISLQAKLDMMVVVRSDSPHKTLKDLMAAMQANPGKMNYAAPGKGTPHYLGMELFLKETKLNAVAVQYQGIAPGVRDLLGGVIDFAFLDLAAALPQVQANKIRVLAVAAQKRLAPIPDVPTMAEVGHPFEAYAWNGIVMPAGVPRPVVERFSQAMRLTMQDEGLRAKFAAAGIEPMLTSGEEYRKIVASDIEKWGPLIRALGIKL